MANPIYGTSSPTKNDTQAVTLTKILETLLAIQSAGTVGNNLYGNGDPNGVVTGNRGQMYIQLDVSPPAPWFKTTDGGSLRWE